MYLTVVQTFKSVSVSCKVLTCRCGTILRD